MKKIFKRLAVILVSAMTVTMLSVTAFAADMPDANGDFNSNGYHDLQDRQRDVTISTQTNYKSALAVCKYYNITDGTTLLDTPRVLDKTYECFEISSNESAVITVKCDQTSFSKLTTDEQKEAKGEMLSEISKMGLEQDTLSKMQENLENQAFLGLTQAELVTMLFADTKADLSTALKWFAPMQGPVGTVLGILVILIIVLLLVSTVFDLVYIGLPMARNILDGKAEQNGQPKPLMVSYDAVKVVQMIEGTGNSSGAGGSNGGSNGNAYFEYLKRRILTYIILAVCILYLVSGEIATLIGGLLDVVSGIGS